MQKKKNVWLTPRKEGTLVLEALGEIEESGCLLTRPIKKKNLISNNSILYLFTC